MATLFKKQPPISLSLQRELIQRRWPQFKCRGNYRTLVSVGKLQPTPLCEVYEVEISYKLQKTPEVYVLWPKLKCREGSTRIPHTYEANRLCLYLPNSGEWTPSKFIADTTIPWTSLWLYYYELWHATGEWLGGGVHPK